MSGSANSAGSVLRNIFFGGGAPVSAPPGEPTPAGRALAPQPLAPRHLQVRSGEPPLPAPMLPRNASCASARLAAATSHSIMAPLGVEREELVGYYYDAEGNAVAELWESLPPPADADYRHTNRAAQHQRFTQLMGYDPSAPPRAKREVEAVVNPAGALPGDEERQLRAHSAHATELAQRDVYLNRQHAQPFAARDWERAEALYDGLNDRRAPAERVRPPPLTGRATLEKAAVPERCAEPVHEAASKVSVAPTSRVEPAAAWAVPARRTHDGALTEATATATAASASRLAAVSAERTEPVGAWRTREAAPQPGEEQAPQRATGAALQQRRVDRLEPSAPWERPSAAAAAYDEHHRPAVAPQVHAARREPGEMWAAAAAAEAAAAAAFEAHAAPLPGRHAPVLGARGAHEAAERLRPPADTTEWMMSRSALLAGDDRPIPQLADAEVAAITATARADGGALLGGGAAPAPHAAVLLGLSDAQRVEASGVADALPGAAAHPAPPLMPQGADAVEAPAGRRMADGAPTGPARPAAPLAPDGTDAVALGEAARRVVDGAPSARAPPAAPLAPQGTDAVAASRYFAEGAVPLGEARPAAPLAPGGADAVPSDNRWWDGGGALLGHAPPAHPLAPEGADAVAAEVHRRLAADAVAPAGGRAAMPRAPEGADAAALDAAAAARHMADAAYTAYAPPAAPLPVYGEDAVTLGARAVRAIDGAPDGPARAAVPLTPQGTDVTRLDPRAALGLADVAPSGRAVGAPPLAPQGTDAFALGERERRAAYDGVSFVPARPAAPVAPEGTDAVALGARERRHDGGGSFVPAARPAAPVAPEGTDAVALGARDRRHDGGGGSFVPSARPAAPMAPGGTDATPSAAHLAMAASLSSGGGRRLTGAVAPLGASDALASGALARYGGGGHEGGGGAGSSAPRAGAEPQRALRRGNADAVNPALGAGAAAAAEAEAFFARAGVLVSDRPVAPEPAAHQQPPRGASGTVGGTLARAAQLTRSSAVRGAQGQAPLPAPAGGGGGGGGGAAVRVAPAPVRAYGGLAALPDRLRAAHPIVGSRIEQRMTPAPPDRGPDRSERATPIPFGR